MTTLAPLDRSIPVRPSALRRTAVVASGVLACLLPTVWTAGTVAELVTGAERDHLFHQITGQGLLLGALWLGGLIPLLVAGWRGVRPGAAAAALHLSVVAGAIVAAALAPGHGGVFVAVIAVVTGALLWAALPVTTAMVGIALVGGARYLFTPETTWSLLAAGLGLLGAAAVAARLARRAG